jgi:hypothetical protein
MHNKNKPVNDQRVANTSRFAKRIGSVTYEVGVHFKKGATETMDSKIMRLIKNEMANTPTAMPIIKPQKGEAV